MNINDVVLGAGVLLTEFDPLDPSVTEHALICATSGGATISVTPRLRDLGEEIPNCPRGTMELTYLAGWDVTIRFTTISATVQTIALALGAADVDGSKVTPRQIDIDDYLGSLWWVGEKRDGNVVAVRLANAISTSGLTLRTAHKAIGKIDVTITAHKRLSDTEEPVEVYSVEEPEKNVFARAVSGLLTGAAALPIVFTNVMAISVNVLFGGDVADGMTTESVFSDAIDHADSGSVVDADINGVAYSEVNAGEKSGHIADAFSGEAINADAVGGALAGSNAETLISDECRIANANSGAKYDALGGGAFASDGLSEGAADGGCTAGSVAGTEVVPVEIIEAGRYRFRTDAPIPTEEYIIPVYVNCTIFEDEYSGGERIVLDRIYDEPYDFAYVHWGLFDLNVHDWIYVDMCEADLFFSDEWIVWLNNGEITVTENSVVTEEEKAKFLEYFEKKEE